MKKSRFTNSQILAVLKQAEAGTPVPQLCREHGISSAAFYKWRSKFGGMDASLVSELKELQDENRRLKKMYGDAQPTPPRLALRAPAFGRPTNSRQICRTGEFSAPSVHQKRKTPLSGRFAFLAERVGLSGASMHPTLPRCALQGRPSAVQICTCKFVEPGWVLT
jgi:putative transposase